MKDRERLGDQPIGFRNIVLFQHQETHRLQPDGDLLAIVDLPGYLQPFRQVRRVGSCLPFSRANQPAPTSARARTGDAVRSARVSTCSSAWNPSRKKPCTIQKSAIAPANWSPASRDIADWALISAVRICHAPFPVGRLRDRAVL